MKLKVKTEVTEVNLLDLLTKTESDTKMKDISKRITSNKSRHLIIENELRKVILEAKVILKKMILKII